MKARDTTTMGDERWERDEGRRTLKKSNRVTNAASVVLYLPSALAFLVNLEGSRSIWEEDPARGGRVVAKQKKKKNQKKKGTKEKWVVVEGDWQPIGGENNRRERNGYSI